MASEKQIAANRRNAAKSTGPKTPKRKQVSRLNARKHGLRAQEVLIPDEEPAGFESYRKDALRDLAPSGFLETELAETIVKSCWRLRRCERIEAGLLGGGADVMDQITHTTIDEFVAMLRPKKNLKDFSESQLMRQIMIMRTEAHYDGTPLEKLPFSLIPGEELVEAYKETLEEEHQSNPLTYKVALAFQRDITKQDALAKLSRYETALRRSLHRAVHELQRLQARRNGQFASAPAVLDVDVSISNE